MTFTVDDITEEMIEFVRREYHNPEVITQDLTDMINMSAFASPVERLRWSDNPVDVDGEVDIDLVHFMWVHGFDKRYRLLAKAVDNGLINRWLNYVHIGKPDTYEQRIVSNARVRLIYDLESHKMVVDQKKIDTLFGQAEAVQGYLSGYIDDLRTRCGQRIMQFDTDTKVRNFILADKEVMMRIQEEFNHG